MTSAACQRRLPIGVQTFREIREEWGHYVDKTGLALQLAESSKHCFLSRPRRFGKSLFLDTLKDLFECNRELFEGLAAEPHWDWTSPHPVVRRAFGAGGFDDLAGLRDTALMQLRSYERSTGIWLESPCGTAGRLASAERAARGGAGVEHNKPILDVLQRCRRDDPVLVERFEHNKPILDVLQRPELAGANRNYLRNLYGVVKNADAHVRFCFPTGVSKFSKVNLFSGLNNLKDITLDPRYSSICGYTEHDLDTVFADWLEGRDRERIREWYDGYSWDGEERVYNPYYVLLLLDAKGFQDWWFETGSPIFLVDLLLKQGVPWEQLDRTVAAERLLSRFDVGHIAPTALLFQTGYLTILEQVATDGVPRYRLGYPNREVRESLNVELLDRVLGADWQRECQAEGLCNALKAGDLRGLERQLTALLAGFRTSGTGGTRLGLRGLVRERALRLLCGLGGGRAGGGERESGPHGSGGSGAWAGVGVRVQDAGTSGAGGGLAAAPGEEVRRALSRLGAAHPFGGCGVQRRDPQRDSVRECNIRAGDICGAGRLASWWVIWQAGGGGRKGRTGGNGQGSVSSGMAVGSWRGGLTMPRRALSSEPWLPARDVTCHLERQGRLSSGGASMSKQQSGVNTSAGGEAGESVAAGLGPCRRWMPRGYCSVTN